ncbi:FecCD family ABC transporter permease [Enterococcus sp. OL5]|uniref:FecCD family ABC transporter permease n=1 Tax=Enterococcus sp. OL5 TaxID=2590214 RepID=UPI00112AC307|nr:iron ABC transporter permease [Enterococcus sp. OL5]TPR55080.1 iron ABC transporter permease [Enterococcus sp. OL5]
MYKRIVFSILAFLLVASLSLSMGSYHLSWSELSRLLFGGIVSEQAYLIFFSFRLPRLVLAALVGGSLAVAGYIIQTLSRNPIADVGLLGINSGAACGSVLYFLLVGAYFSELKHYQYASLLMFGLIGACLAIFLNLFLSFRGSQVHMTLFLLNGIAINLGFSAITTFLSLKINPEDYERVNQWIEGSIASASWETTRNLLPVVFITVLLVVLTAKRLAVLRFQDLHLLNIGFPYGRWRLFFLLIAAVLVSATVFVAGSVAFISLLAPHLTLLYLDRRSPILVPIIFLNGMTLAVFADIVAKNLFSPNEIPLNAVMGAIGLPYLIGLYIKNRSKTDGTSTQI